MSNKLLDLSIVIVTFNSAFWLEKLLVSLQQHFLGTTKKNVAVTVVDNNSQDNTQQLVKNFSFVKFIRSAENIGFAAANNIAIKSTRARQYLLLNSDTEITANSNLDKLINFLSKNPKIGVLTPRLSLSTGKLDMACHRGEPTLSASLFYFLNLDKVFPSSKLFGAYHLTYKNLNEIHTIDACSGACLLIKKDVIDTIGLLDERFFMYAEDLDWCKRTRDAGYLIVYHPGGNVIHHKYKSGIKTTSQKIAKKTRIHFYETMLQYYDKHHAKSNFGFLRVLLKVFIYVKKGGL